MPETSAQRIQRLEREIAELKALHPPRKQSPIEQGVTVSYSRSSPIELPSPAEYERLLTIVGRAGVVPTFASENDRREFFAGFVGSFERIASLRRTEGLNLKRPAREWADEAYGWLNQRATPAETTNGSYVAAILAAGDIAYSFAKPTLGIPAYVGLDFDPDGRVATAAGWRRVLENGKPRTPDPTPEPGGQTSRTSQVRITG
jgi:hypothetical protein